MLPSESDAIVCMSLESCKVMFLANDAASRALFAVVSSVYLFNFCQSEDAYTLPFALETTQVRMSPPSCDHKSPISYGGEGCTTNVLLFPPAVSCAFSACASALEMSLS